MIRELKNDRKYFLGMNSGCQLSELIFVGGAISASCCANFVTRCPDTLIGVVDFFDCLGIENGTRAGLG